MELVLLETRYGLEQRPRLLAGLRAGHAVAIARDDVVETPQSRVQRETRRRVWLARELLPSAIHVIPVDVGVGQDVRELVGHEIGDLRGEVQGHRVLGGGERYAEEQVAG